MLYIGSRDLLLIYVAKPNASGIISESWFTLGLQF